nr:hypothetical protein CFP56_70018 [Quercus suber]
MCFAASMVMPDEACRRNAGDDQTRMGGMATEVGGAVLPPSRLPRWTLIHSTVLYTVRPSPIPIPLVATGFARPLVYILIPLPTCWPGGRAALSRHRQRHPTRQDRRQPPLAALRERLFPAHTCYNGYSDVASYGPWRMEVPRPIHPISPPIVHPSVHQPVSVLPSRHAVVIGHASSLKRTFPRLSSTSSPAADAIVLCARVDDTLRSLACSA